MNRTLSFSISSPLSLLIALFLLSHISILFAQPPAFPYTPPMNFNYGPFKMPVNKKYEMTVYIKDGRVIRDSLAFYWNFNGYYLKIDQEKITPAKTDSVIASGFLGLPVEKNWAWRIKTGKLNFYTNKPVGGNSYSYIDKRDKSLSLTPYSNDALERAVSDNSKSWELMKSYRLGLTNSILMLVGGGALFSIGLLTFEEHVPEIRIPFILSGVVLLGSGIPFALVQKKKEIAIQTYNRDGNNK